MRNWNYVEQMAEVHLCNSSQRTYEELKLAAADWKVKESQKFSAYLWGIETRTISPIRASASSVLSVPMRNWNLFLRQFALFRGFVLSVPMRNWNPGGSGPRGRRLGTFSAYLWGIETNNPSNLIGIIFLFSAYLWGIETSLLPTPAPSSPGSQRTYEELKPW